MPKTTVFYTKSSVSFLILVMNLNGVEQFITLNIK